MDGDMKPGTLSLGNASCYIGYSQVTKPNQRGLLREITNFEVPEEHRGKGDGTELLKDICDQADERGIVLLIKADTIRLEIFYKRHGFITLQALPDIIMVRQPVKH